MLKLSFILPCYNVAPYIERCARSLFEQTLDDIEYVFVEDCSTDNGLEILMSVLDEYPNRKPHVNIIHHEKNKGIAETKKDGYLGATGEYVICLDSDDCVDLRMAELMYAKAVQSDADCVICDFFYSSDKDYEAGSIPQDFIDRGVDLRSAILNRDLAPYLGSKLVRRTVLTGNDIVWGKGSYGEDVVLSAMEAFYSKKVECVNVPLHHYRYNPNSISNQIDEQRLVRNHVEYSGNIQIIEDFFRSKGCVDQFAKGLYISKVNVRNYLLPLVGKKKYRRMWMKSFPETNKAIFWGDKSHKSTYRDKIWYLGVTLGFYPRFRKILIKKIFRPGPEWEFGIFRLDALYKNSLKKV